MKSRSLADLVIPCAVLALATSGCGSPGQGNDAGRAEAGGGTQAAAGTNAGGNPSQPSSGGGAGGGSAGAGGTLVAGPGGMGGTGTSGAAGAALAGGGGATPSPPEQSPTCTENSLHAGNDTITIQYANVSRNYVVHVPKSYTGTARVPLLIDMHGSGQDAANQMGSSGWDRKADATGFVVIYPNALNARWNAGTCCSLSVEQNVDDVGFLRAVVDKTLQDGCIDRKRVYASGLSGGGLMSYRLACEAADLFAAVAPVSGATVFSPCQPAAPVSVIAFRGLGDPLVPYNGGMPLKWYFQGAKADFDQWSMLEKCAGPITMSHGICQTNTQCSGGADVTLCSVNGGHVLYGDAAGAGAAVPDVAWEIFSRHQLP